MYKYILINILNIKNFLLFLTFFLVSLGIILSLSICFTFLNLRNDLYIKNIRFRTILVNTADEEKYSILKDINHVLDVEDSIFQNPVEIDAKEFDSDLKGKILLNPLLNINNLKIKDGKNIKNYDEAICSSVFYPYEIEIKDNKVIFNKDRLIKPKDFIGKTFTAHSVDNKELQIKFKIVGTYDSETNNNYLNSCYVSKESFTKIKSEYSSILSNYNEQTGEYDYIKQKYTGKIIIIDDYKNMDNVINQLKENGFTYMLSSELNAGYVKLITITPILFSTIISLIFIVVLNNFLNKKIKNKSRQYAILKSIGYSKKKIIQLEIYENVFISLISFSASLFIYTICFYHIKNNVFAEYIYDGTNLRMSFIPIFLTMIIIITITFILNVLKLNKKLDYSINEVISKL